MDTSDKNRLFIVQKLPQKMVPDSDEINLSTVELQVLTELDRLVDSD